ncbi:hypothetical protein CL621_03750 [archaeon]|nr:hypothetical protein [archaeon]|tara:strand:- start:1462 stop:2085 length:624 start_codon:yes stop_codon:yes gene_type:complete
MRDMEEHKTPEEWYHDSFEKLVENGMSKTQVKEILDPGYAFIVTDPLTGVYNRRVLYERLEALAKQEIPLCIDMLDVDHFKNYNDTYGHGQGDIALKQITSAIKAGTKSEDILARYGGEEFTLILPRTDLKGAKRVTERVRKNVEDMIMEASSENLKEGFEKTTISQGATWHDGSSIKTADQLLKEADVALYEAKKERNMVSFYHLI